MNLFNVDSYKKKSSRRVYYPFGCWLGRVIDGNLESGFWSREWNKREDSSSGLPNRGRDLSWVVGGSLQNAQAPCFIQDRRPLAPALHIRKPAKGMPPPDKRGWNVRGDSRPTKLNYSSCLMRQQLYIRLKTAHF